MNMPLVAVLFFGALLLPAALSLAQPVAWEGQERPLKLKHAEPLYIDLIRDLGAHKGEKEWNVGMAMVDRERFDSYEFLVEYEWAIRDRWGMELEVPVTVYTPNRRHGGEPNFQDKPSNRIESLKMATQYTFLVSAKARASLAVGNILEWELMDLDRISARTPLQGVLLNPFLVAAKQVGRNWHTLLYTGPRMNHHFGHSGLSLAYEANTSVHYMIPGSRNFIGMEWNKQFSGDGLYSTLRPQMRLMISESLMAGIVTGIPIRSIGERLSAFLRLIYEPGHHASKS